MSTHKMHTRQKAKIPQLCGDVWDLILTQANKPDIEKHRKEWQEAPPSSLMLPRRSWIRPMNNETHQIRKRQDAALKTIYQPEVDKQYHQEEYCCVGSRHEIFKECSTPEEYEDYRKEMRKYNIPWWMHEDVCYDIYTQNRSTVMTRCSTCGYSESDVGCQCEDSFMCSLCTRCGNDDNYCTCTSYYGADIPSDAYITDDEM